MRLATIARAFADGVLTHTEFQAKKAEAMLDLRQATECLPYTQKGQVYQNVSMNEWDTFEDAKVELHSLTYESTRLRWKFLQLQGGKSSERQRIYLCASHEDCPVRASVSKRAAGGWQVKVSVSQLHNLPKNTLARSNARMTNAQEVRCSPDSSLRVHVASCYIMIFCFKRSFVFMICGEVRAL